MEFQILARSRSTALFFFFAVVLNQIAFKTPTERPQGELMPSLSFCCHRCTHEEPVGAPLSLLTQRFPEPLFSAGRPTDTLMTQARLRPSRSSPPGGEEMTHWREAGDRTKLVMWSQRGKNQELEETVVPRQFAI